MHYVVVMVFKGVLYNVWVYHDRKEAENFKRIVEGNNGNNTGDVVVSIREDYDNSE